MTSAFGELTVIADPSAGGGGVRAQLPGLEAALRDRELPYTLHVTDRGEEVTAAAARALREGARYLVAVGGDRTVQQVVNGMFDGEGRPLAEEPVLGVVAAGSGCDLVRSFGLPGDTVGAVGHLGGANTYDFDVVKITTTGPGGERCVRYSHNLAEAGFGAAVQRRRASLPDWTGRAQSFLAFWLTLARTRSGPGGGRGRHEGVRGPGVQRGRGERAVLRRRPAPVARGRSPATASSTRWCSAARGRTR